jgi:hypothetical protein
MWLLVIVGIFGLLGCIVRIFLLCLTCCRSVLSLNLNLLTAGRGNSTPLFTETKMFKKTKIWTERILITKVKNLKALVVPWKLTHLKN